MLHNYITTAIRNLIRARFYSAINILGLAIGLAAVILIVLFVSQDLLFDRFWPHAARTYRVEKTLFLPGRPDLPGVTTQGPLRDALIKDFPQIEAATRLKVNSATLSAGDKKFTEDLGYADGNFFEVLTPSFRQGDARSALATPQSIALSASLAAKYFGQANPLGRTLTVDRGGPVDYVVTAVFDDIPAASHLVLSAVIAIDTTGALSQNLSLDRWFSTNFYTYLRLAPRVLPAALSARLENIADRHMEGPEGKRASEFIKFFLTNVQDIHMRSPHRNMMKPPGDETVLIGLSVIAGIILLIAAINFINLATARATTRHREVALRKILGAKRRQLIFQFISEALVLTLLAMVLGLAAVEIILPFLNHALATDLSLSQLADPQFAGSILATTVIFGLITGLYPARVISAERPAAGLSSGPDCRSRPSRIRVILVFLQFAASIGLVAATLIIGRQIDFAASSELGFISDHMVVVRGGKNRPLMDAFAAEAARMPGVLSVGFSSLVPGDGDDLITSARRASQSPAEAVDLTSIGVGPNFFPTYRISAIAGRRFDDSHRFGAEAGDEDKTESVILNATAVRTLGFETAADAVGAQLSIGARAPNAIILGVVPDFRIRSARHKPRPIVFMANDRLYKRNLTLRFRTADERQFLAGLDDLWRKFAPDHPLNQIMLNDNLSRLYVADQRNNRLLAAGAILAVFISCLGLFGLASLSTQQRTREIGIRKVLGARIADIVKLLTWQFSKPVLLANVIAWPIVWYFMDRWLDQFAYQIDLHLGYFLAAGAGALVIAFATVAGHAIRVARANPINALRYE